MGSAMCGSGQSEASTITESNQDRALTTLWHTVVRGVDDPPLDAVPRADALVNGGKPKPK
jgi:hypothetical protein